MSIPSQRAIQDIKTLHTLQERSKRKDIYWSQRQYVKPRIERFHGHIHTAKAEEPPKEGRIAFFAIVIGAVLILLSYG